MVGERYRGSRSGGEGSADVERRQGAILRCNLACTKCQLLFEPNLQIPLFSHNREGIGPFWGDICIYF